ncbi:MAG: tRNA (adenosine(37)-N6)-threonylcarbamoyltransferase complex dimerization subunit type 1 TsaB [Pirellulaceae bacterium]|nr:MAG: tRNA (adenosine(37)-N6)-threonylcarbamoyltransferase complex dimerization subunit type 1 TsaB [Pirellulaceae bacterium]
MNRSVVETDALLVLGLETSHAPGAVALLAGERCIERWLPEQQSTTASLLVAAQELLSQWERSPQDVGLLCISRGPGSFTGLRIAMTVAKIWGYVRHVPVVAVPTPVILAAQIPAVLDELWVLLDAQRRELFAQRFKKREGCWQPAGPCQIMSAAQWWERLENRCQVVGTGWRRAEGRGGVKESLVDVGAASAWRPAASTLCRVGWHLYQEGQVADPWTLVPDYVRPSGAEER